MRIGYPKDSNLKCPLCEHDVKYTYANDGKIVHTLKGDINQIINLYTCTNEECVFHDKAFNPAPRYDYGARHYGADVFRLIADEFLIYELKADQIYKRLDRKYQLKIYILLLVLQELQYFQRRLFCIALQFQPSLVVISFLRVRGNRHYPTI